MVPLISMTFITGLLSSAHCLGMCGGIISALSLTKDGPLCGPSCQLLFNLGRVTTYALLGLLVGWLGSALAVKNSIYEITSPLLICSDIFIILIGLGSAGLFKRLNFSLLKCTVLRPRLDQAAKMLTTLPTPLAAISLGLLFGFMPCGVLYAMLLTATQSGDRLTGCLMMAAFGLGTAPVMLLVGHTTHWFSKSRNWTLPAIGVMVAFIGAYNLLNHLSLFN